MNYLQEASDPLLPRLTPGDHAFFGSKNFYFFARNVWILYERFCQAKAMAYKFEVNSKTQKLDEAQKKTIGKSRYQVFLQIVILRTKESSIFEEQLRMIFEQHAYKFSTLDRLLACCSKALQRAVSEDFRLLYTPFSSAGEQGLFYTRLLKQSF
jgi:histone deacetylase complex regulatory component SIN3